MDSLTRNPDADPVPTLRVPCPVCGASPGAPCVGVVGDHAHRIELARSWPKTINPQVGISRCPECRAGEGEPCAPSCPLPLEAIS